MAEVQAELESTRAELESVRAEFVRVQEEAETATARATRLAEDLQRAKYSTCSHRMLTSLAPLTHLYVLACRALPRETGVDPALVPTLEAQITYELRVLNVLLSIRLTQMLVVMGWAHTPLQKVQGLHEALPEDHPAVQNGSDEAD